MVPTIYPLETLHNALSLRQVSEFLSRVCQRHTDAQAQASAVLSYAFHLHPHPHPLPGGLGSELMGYPPLQSGMSGCSGRDVVIDGQ